MYGSLFKLAVRLFLVSYSRLYLQSLTDPIYVKPRRLTNAVYFERQLIWVDGGLPRLDTRQDRAIRMAAGASRDLVKLRSFALGINQPYPANFLAPVA